MYEILIVSTFIALVFGFLTISTNDVSKNRNIIAQSVGFV